ncbi:EAL domain-containing protein [Desulfitispora alkaliphila]|uniref:EAL domain-containing protein n=1 Tax=Desulfitispora alkaliphila TaxID=622674 RepID=UPI003D1FBD6F
MTINHFLKRGDKVTLIYLDIVKFTYYKEVHGPKLCREILKFCSTFISNNRRKYFKGEYISFEQSGDEFFIYKNHNSNNLKHLSQLVQSLCTDLEEALINNYPKIKPIQFHKSFALLEADESVDTSIYNALKRAYNMARTPMGLEQAEHYQSFKQLLENKAISTLYQPIVSLKTGSTLGWESLTRGPKNSFFHSPGNLFPFAEASGHLYRLEKIARETALTTIHRLGLPANSKIFININPDIINDPDFIGGQTRELLNSLGISPANIVFEITEGTSIDNFAAFRKTLEHYRKQGFLVAVDDAGSGYSSLQTIAELKPDYIKMDLSLIRDIHSSPVKQALTETFVTFSKKINSYLIAEGIETQEELTALINLGVDYGQGFYLARPSENISNPKKSVRSQIVSMQSISCDAYSTMEAPISKLSVDTKCYAPEITTREVVDFFSNNSDVIGVVVLQDKTPVGLVMKDYLHGKLSNRYGASLYMDKPIQQIMNANPLIVDCNTTIETVSQLVIQRNHLNSNDHMIIVNDAKYQGIVPVKDLILYLTEVNQKRVDLAYAANPLSGLPGNITIQQELDQRLKEGTPMSLIYADIDRFKQYNDTYGFENGDKVIGLTAKSIVNAVNDYLEDRTFVGHIGGDDFLILTKPSLAEAISSKIIGNFEAELSTLHQTEASILSISLAIVDTETNISTSPFQLAQIAAQLKSYAKKQPGSTVVRDRRSRD